MATFSDWFKAAHEKNVPLEDFLKIDLAGDIARLYSSGLPVLENRIVDGRQYQSDPSGLTEFCARHEQLWVRVYNREKKGERYSRFGLAPSDARIFVDNLGLDLRHFDIQLFECHTNRFGGNVVAGQGGTYVEMAVGSQDIVGKDLGPYCHGFISCTGGLRFHEADAPIGIKTAAWNVLSYLKLSRGEYLPGYFEFIVSDKNKVYFLDYKASISEGHGIKI